MLPEKHKHEEITRGVHDDTARWITVRCNGMQREITKLDLFEEFCRWAGRSWYTPTQFYVSLHDPKTPAVEGRKVGFLWRVVVCVCDERKRVGSRPG